ncbi:MAG: hypothetical protein A2904_00075 [Candidatus Staskawiczbacteria bacterium RIFCSPLOWO2_01_FULL_33_9]|uniref:Uncharacterized protein n=1 Tax=Candidatus Staskawiczbacteria bacterium RIFCSPLOWO2_01_FULL_33_9 TaxID=1802211 RepID=A0A1G2I686_9BACT|nr:MAG: hypothetical protein A2904_00075 [Candidatus Staskawiczbacteria bacterium RIFCSPLOWO2_01_FULL_33_9]
MPLPRVKPGIDASIGESFVSSGSSHFIDRLKKENPLVLDFIDKFIRYASEFAEKEKIELPEVFPYLLKTMGVAVYRLLESQQEIDDLEEKIS